MYNKSSILCLGNGSAEVINPNIVDSSDGFYSISEGLEGQCPSHDSVVQMFGRLEVHQRLMISFQSELSSFEISLGMAYAPYHSQTLSLSLVEYARSFGRSFLLTGNFSSSYSRSKTAPNPLSDASVLRMKGLVTSGKWSIGSLVSLFLSVVKASS